MMQHKHLVNSNSAAVYPDASLLCQKTVQIETEGLIQNGTAALAAIHSAAGV